MIHLDTSFAIAALVRGSPEDRRLRAWLREGEEIGVSAIAWAELLCGPLGPGVVELLSRIVGEPAPYGAAEAVAAARLFNETGRRRGSLADCTIAAAAIGAGAALATTDLRGFARFAAAGLALVDR